MTVHGGRAGDVTVTRRVVLKRAAAAGVMASVPAWPSSTAVARASRPAPAWRDFDAAIAKEFRRMGLVGAAVAVVSADQVHYARTLGVRSLQTRAPVTDPTHFLVASTTKSMSSLLVATYVDQGKLAWDQRVIDAWPGFRAPTDQLTNTLRVRDLLGMATGIGEPPALSGLHEGDPTAPQLLQSVVNLPLIGKPNEKFFYNNTVYAVGGYLPALAQHVAPDQLPATYAREMHSRVYGPVGMTGARVTDDPRGLVKNYSAGHGLDLFAKQTTLPYGAVGSYAPVGGTLATLDDMAAYVRLQLRRGVSVHGRRVVSAANLAECWKPHIPIPTDPRLDPSALSAGYAMGWISTRYSDGSSLVWHNGGIDGFTTLIAFMPEHDIGLVVLNSVNPGPTGLFFYQYVLNLLLNRFGLNNGVPAKVDNDHFAAITQLRVLARKSRRASPDAIAPFLGHYEGGYELAIHGGVPTIILGSRIMPLRKRIGGGYIMSGGLLVENDVKLDRDQDGVPRMEIVGMEAVRRTVGSG
jgi:CubicO group peptidase (beta-lactamase class C family)